eukprot:15364935-Ditylum_brightwellii.AAC.2
MKEKDQSVCQRRFSMYFQEKEYFSYDSGPVEGLATTEQITHHSGANHFRTCLDFVDHHQKESSMEFIPPPELTKRQGIKYLDNYFNKQSFKTTGITACMQSSMQIQQWSRT